MFVSQSRAAHVLQAGASLTPSSPPLTSRNAAFILSFRPFSATSSTSSLYLAISFAAAPLDPPAWVANPNNPVSPSATLSLSSTFTLHDPSSFAQPLQIYSSSSPAGLRAQLLDSGNLALLNSSSSSSIVWQSFDHPTNTLLPAQPFGLAHQLVSQKTSDSFASGRYLMQFDASGSLQLTDSLYVPTPSFTADYWSWPGAAAASPFLELDPNGTFSFFNSPGVVNSSIISSDYGANATRRVTLDMDGNLRMYSWDPAVSQWIRVWLAFDNICTVVKGLCGSYGICIYNPEPSCICPPGFSVQPGSTELSRGCLPNSPLQDCSNNDYIMLDSTDFPFNDEFDTTHLSETDCKQRCSSDCTCLAAVYWQSIDPGHCWLKSRVLNGYSLQSQHVRSFLKISNSTQSTPTVSNYSSTLWSPDTVWQRPAPISSNETNASRTAETLPQSSSKTIVISLIAVIGVLILCFTLVTAYLLWGVANKPKYTEVRRADLDLPIMFSYEDLEAATQQFAQKLGSGGFGTVYKGQLPNGKVVAVKRLEGVSQSDKQFRTEIFTLGKIHHINLLRLYGFCEEGDQRLLVYEYMENGSLDGVLFHHTPDQSHQTTLNWDTRFQICLGVARGMTYLHEECLECILHCDIKPQNILLDVNYCAKVADFGLAYLFTRDHTVQLTTIRGTRGYLAPEWVMNLPITTKVDVFSYGMLLLEIVSGRSNYLLTESKMMDEDGKWCFPVWAYERKVEEVVDERMGAEVDYEQAEAVLKVAFLCIQRDMNCRPSMGKVVQMLERTVPIPEPPRPD